MTWETQIKEMVGKSFRRDGEPVTLHKYLIRDSGLVEILTDVDDYEMPASEVPAFLATFENAFRPAKRKPDAITATVSDTSKLRLMQDALMSALDKVQSDPKFVPQAEQIGRLVQTGINLAKLELTALQLARQ